MASFADSIYQGLLDRGFPSTQAAAITGNIQQESNFNPSALNSKEGAFGLIQWRGERRAALNDFAKSHGTDPSDSNTQLDFIRQEMGGSEAKNSQEFLSAPDLQSANAALKKYIRYGDDSEPTRLKYATSFAGMPEAKDVSPLPKVAEQQAPPLNLLSFLKPGAAQSSPAMPAYNWSPQQQPQQQAMAQPYQAPQMPQLQPAQFQQPQIGRPQINPQYLQSLIAQSPAIAPAFRFLGRA